MITDFYSGTVLITGGAGYIGSHTVYELVSKDIQVVVIDNLVNSNIESIHRLEKMTGKNIAFFKIDLLDRQSLDDLFSRFNFSSVIHFAGLKAVGESVSLPLMYYSNNLVGTLNLLEIMQAHHVSDIVFSSSATVYGDPDTLPISENAHISATNPYGRTKQFIEDILIDVSKAHKWKVIILRYFNPVGAHSSGLIGENPIGVPNNLMPFVAQVAVGVRPIVNIFGNDYSTADGTGVRDYIHVVDLSIGHLLSLYKLSSMTPGETKVYNLGTGEGYSVLDMIKAMSVACGHDIPYNVVGRRHGDVAAVYANPALANEELQWSATRSLQTMCNDLWRWQKMNPHGYVTATTDNNAVKFVSSEPATLQSTLME